MTIKAQLDAIRQKDFLTLTEAALLLGVSVKTLRRRQARIPGTIRDGRVIRLHRVSAVRFFLQVRPRPQA